MLNFQSFLICITTTLLLLSCSSQKVIVQQPKNQSTSELIAHYPLDGTANDIINGLNGKLYGTTPTSDRKDKPDSAFNFDGIDDYIDLGTYSEFEFITNYSLSLWIYYSGNKQRCSILNKRQNVKPYSMYSIAINGDGLSGEVPGNNLVFTNISENGGTPKVISNRGFQISKGWHHIVLTNKINGKANLYVDSQFIGTASNGGSVKLSGIPLLIGKAVGNSFTNDLYFEGKIDDIRIYKGILSSQDITALFSN